MTPQIIHRYAIPIADAIKALVGDISADRKEWSLRLEGGEIIIDAVEPAVSVTQTEIDEGRPSPSNETAKSNVASPERKGGALAQRAGIICGEKGFWTFAGVRSADEAATWLRERCGIKSRVYLDYEATAAAAFHEVDRRYRLWLEGYD